MPVKDKVNILMVDDHPGKLLSYEAILGELGENLVKASSGTAALELLLKIDVAVVLVDVSMPDIDGFELAEMIRQHPRFQRLAILFISGVHLTDLDRVKGYQRGAVDYISVPVIPELLRAKVSVFAELYRKTNQLEALNLELENRVTERTDELAKRAGALQTLNAELERKNQELGAIVTTVPDIIFSRQANGVYDFVSDQFREYTGAASVLTDADWAEFVHSADRQSRNLRWKESIENAKNFEVEYRLLGKDKNFRWFRSRAVPIRNSEGEIIRWYGSCSDIHDSKVSEQSMRDNSARLERMVQDRTAELRRLSVRLMTMQDEERRRIALEIHDGLGQELAAAKMMVDAVNNLPPSVSGKQAVADASKLIDRAIQQVRSISHLLHPPLLDEVGLHSALRWYLEGLSERSGIETTLDVQPENFARLSSEMETAIFRIIQEALTNVFRHSRAQKAWVSLVRTQGQILVRVADNGRGFEQETVLMRPGSIGVGLSGMKQRAQELGGELHLTNTKPGSSVEVMIPLKSEKSSEEENSSAAVQLKN